jgi:transketolase
VNGVALSEGKITFCLGSDGAQQEGSDVEAARLAVKLKLNVKLIIDDNSQLNLFSTWASQRSLTASQT